jgi:methylated-DNA-[protein]-cysteine S-methyltransferase
MMAGMAAASTPEPGTGPDTGAEPDVGPDLDAGGSAEQGWTVFDTAIGCCGIAWGPQGITGVQLPEPSDAELRSRLADAHPDAAAADPPAPVRQAIERIRLVLDGSSHDDLADLELDLSGLSDFLRRAYAVARTIRPGQTLTYGQVAARIGSPGLARAVGRAMGANPFPIIVPCHRVLGADGTIGGFSAPGGAVTKRRMLLAEGVPEHDGPALFGAEELFPSSAGSV